ncbi:hypothetical protein K523DRAFT_412494 [Schizophyllum commune Tattone D]|nr:hypothetical protein K523DRAFT_412494 [Schizophyllum commune Tattone D]
MLHGGGARFCTLVVVIVFGTLYFTTLHSHSGDEAFSSAGLLEKAQNAVGSALARRHHCPVPRSSQTRAIDHTKQTCVPLDSPSTVFAVSFCYERDAYDAFTMRVRRLNQEECARVEEQGPQADREDVREFVQTERGPDTFWLRVDGAERTSTQRSVYEGGCSYRFDVPVRNAGDLYVELFHAWEEYLGFIETDDMRARPWPPLLNNPLLSQTLRIPWGSSDCRPYNVPPLFESHHTKVPAPLSPFELMVNNLPSCAGLDPITGSYYRAHTLDVLWPEIYYPQPLGRPVGGRYRFMPHDCEWRHAGMRAASAHRCTGKKSSVYTLGDSHGRLVHDGVIHRLNGTAGQMTASPKLEFKTAEVGEIDFAFQWDPRGELMVIQTERLCATLKEREVDIYFASIAFHLAIDQPTHVFLERVEKLFDAVDQCTDAEYAGPSTRILLTPAAAAPRQDLAGSGLREKNTNVRHAYWSALVAPLAKSRGWALLDQFALTEPIAWEPMFMDKLHYLLTDAVEALVDEAVGRTGLCPEGY